MGATMGGDRFSIMVLILTPNSLNLLFGIDSSSTVFSLSMDLPHIKNSSVISASNLGNGGRSLLISVDRWDARMLFEGEIMANYQVKRGYGQVD